MHLGALIDVGVPELHLRTQLSKLRLDTEFKLDVVRSKKQGISGTLASVSTTSEQHSVHRHLSDIQAIYDRSDLDSSTVARSLEMFRALAIAEAKIHDVDVNEVHFHEVGAVDAIVDITAAAIGLEYLDVDHVFGNYVELGSGWVKCEHGRMPVPAPATAELLLDIPTKRGGVSGEATTPTGATILRSTVQSWNVPESFLGSKVGYGIGQKDFEKPNVLRLTLGTVENEQRQTENQLIECNIDDMSPEAFEPLMDQLFELGANDVYLSHITMKRSRPGTKIAVLCEPMLEDSVVNCIFENSSTIGVRTTTVAKRMLDRSIQKVPTRHGLVQVKVSRLPGGAKRWKSEHSDVMAIARTLNIPYLQIKDEIDQDVAAEMEAS